MSIYSTAIKITKGDYTVYCQAVGNFIDHIVIEKEIKESKRPISSIMLNEIQVDNLINTLEHLNIFTGVINKTYIVSDYFNSYILKLIINIDTVVLYDSDDIITINTELFLDILKELQQKLDEYKKKETEKFF